MAPPNLVKMYSDQAQAMNEQLLNMNNLLAKNEEDLAGARSTEDELRKKIEELSDRCQRRDSTIQQLTEKGCTYKSRLRMSAKIWRWRKRRSLN